MIMGLLWLSAVPLAGGTVAVVFGVGNPPMLNASWFPFHPVGASLGEWLGGYPCNATGSHQLIWSIAIGLSITTSLNLTVRGRVVRRPALTAI